MRALVYITNYEGNAKRTYLNAILRGINTLALDIDVIIYSTEELEIEVFPNLDITINIYPKVFSSSKYANKYQPEPEFIWLHRIDILKKVEQYNLFIHLEDDVCLTKENVEQFITYSFGEKKLDGYIIGNIVYENDGADYLLPQFHAGFKGIGKIITLNGEQFMVPKNKHQGSYLVSQAQLKLLIANGEMTAQPKLAGRYNIKCSACTEIYCTPFLTKIIPIGNLDRCLTEHISLKYVNENKRKRGKWFNAFQTLKEIKMELKEV